MVKLVAKCLQQQELMFGMMLDATSQEAQLDSSQLLITIFKSVELNSTLDKEDLPEDQVEEPEELQEDLEVEEVEDHTLVEMVE
jgi:hypothetical protein